MDTSGILFHNNRGSFGGALHFFCSTMNISSNNSVKFIINTAQVKGGAISIGTGIQPSIIVGNYSKLLLFNNSAFQGGALYTKSSSFMITVGYRSTIQFINNTAFDVGGAVYSLSSKILYIHDHRLLS